jgi:NADH-quinone oxidoreductase subunit M
LAGFWGEFPVILSAYQPGAGLPEETFRTYMVIAALGTVLAAGYLLWLFQRTAFGEPSERFADEVIADVNVYEWVAWTPFLIGILVLGIYPNLLFGLTDDAVLNIVSMIGN